MSYEAFVAECQRIFGADRYGWSAWEQEAAQQAWADGIDPQEAVWRMNDCWVRRMADRNA